MLASQLFYTQLALKNLEPYLRNNSSKGLAIDIDKFPLLLTQSKYKASDFKFYEKYIVPTLHTKCFTNVLELLSKTTLEDIDKFTGPIQPSLIRKIRKGFLLKKSYLNLTSAQIKSTKIISQSMFKGVFMHRDLNMPKECYSVEKRSQTDIALRMRTKMTREDHVGLLIQKQKLYNENNYRLEKFYMDGYENFVQHEKVTRFLIQINAQIKGKMITSQKEEVKLPSDVEKTITTHIIQIESIKIPSRPSIETTLVTDIDYFMEGNPFTA